MKRLTILGSALLVSLLISGLPVLSAENKIIEELLVPKKDTCLLFARNCQDNAYLLQQRIDRLQEELFRGTTVYSHDELNILRQKLDEANKALEFIFNEGA